MQDFLVDYWNDSAGLPQKSVAVILQKSDGYLWIGTKGGLARFDGMRFLVYDDTKLDQLKEREVWALSEDSDGSLWIGTYGGGLYSFKNHQFTQYSTGEGLPSSFITCLLTGRDGALWIGTLKGLAQRSNGRFTSYTTAHGLPGDSITALHLDPDGTVWIGTSTGLASYADGRLQNHAQTQPELAGPISGIVSDDRGGLWIGMWEATRGYGLRRYRQGAVEYRQGAVESFTTQDGLPSDDVTCLRMDNRGTLWIGTMAGLCRLRDMRFETYYSEIIGAGGQGTLERAALRNIQTLAFDQEGSLWIGTSFDGLFRLKDSPFTLVTGEDAAGSNPDVRTVYEDRQGVVWLATTTGIKRIESGIATFVPLPDGLGAQALGQDTEGTLWVGTEGGLFSLRDGQLVRAGDPQLAGLNVSALLGDDRGNLWIGARSNGLYQLSDGGVVHHTEQTGLLGRSIRALAQDQTGGIWVGAKDGGVSYLRAGRCTTYGLEEGLPSSSVQAIMVDGENVVWVGTRQGLARIRDGKVATISARHELPANYFFQIAEDDFQHLWLNYGGGVARVARSELNAVADGEAERVQAVVYRSSSGLRSTIQTVPNQPVAQRTRDGRIWLPTAHGAAVIDPSVIARNTVPPPVHIEQLQNNGVAYLPEDGMELPPVENELEISFTGLSYLAPERVRFRYLLEGFSADWVDAGSRRIAYFTRLPPGTYTFKVQACNNDGVWNDQGASLRFRVVPRFYETAWFMALAGLVLVGTVLGLYRLRIRRHLRMEEVLQARIEEAVAHIQTLVETIDDNSLLLASSSEQLSKLSREMSANAEETSDQAKVVTVSAEQVNANIQNVAGAVEELNASVREIAVNANEAARIAGSAVAVAEATNSTIATLGASSAGIGNVVKAITSIAEQTNLLALNATIEAARAGKAGAGFGVVANEVKDLARETAKATEDIRDKVSAIQNDYSKAIDAISEISSIIESINGIQMVIASAVEEQTATTAEIGRNIDAAAGGSSEIAGSICSVADAAERTSIGAASTLAAADELAEMAAQLRNTMNRSS